MSGSRDLRVTVIPPEAEATVSGSDVAQRLRVAAYCRVSTNSEEQLNSYQAQLEYYVTKIKSHPDWILVGIYADQGISGTALKGRKEFKRMIRDCERGKVDLIITKSVSRFSRNTLDGLEFVRKLKNIGVGVFFEKENVNTLTLDNELVLTFMMSMAQAESESLSGNVKWGHRKNFKDGKVYYNYSNFLGYCEGADGNPEIDPEEAEIVRRIYHRYLQGQSVAQIIRDLEADGIKTVRGNDKWRDAVIRGILTNEKYMGDALLQKTFVPDVFTKRSKKNTGQLPKYYVHDCHPAIIDKETFERVQVEMARRSCLPQRSMKTITKQAKYSGKYALTEVLKCGECGASFRRVIWTIKGEKRIVWRCLTRMDLGKESCEAPTVYEDVLHAAIVRSINQRIDGHALQAALKEAAALADNAPAAQAAMLALLESQPPVLQEYDDLLTRQLLKRVVVLDEDRFEIKYK